MNTFNKLSKEGTEIALSSIAFIAGRSAAAKFLGEINRERKANATDPDKAIRDAGFDNSIDHANEELAETSVDAAHERNTQDLGYEATVSARDYCVLLAYANDELEVLANGANWPRQQSVSGIVDWLCKATPQAATQSRLAAFKAMIKAHSGADLPDEDAKKLFTEEAQAKAEFFANAYTEHRAEIIERMEAAIGDASGLSSFDSVFDNLPRNVKANLLGSIDFKLNDKADELLTGRRRNGQAAASASIPIYVRAGTIALIRDDQKKIKAERDKLADAIAA